MSLADDQAAGLRQMFGVTPRAIGWIDCLAVPFDPEALNARASIHGLEFVSSSRRNIAFDVLLFEANEPSVLTAYARLKALGAQHTAARPIFAWSQTALSQEQKLIDNLVSTARHFLGLAIDYQGAVDLLDPEAAVTWVERIAGLASREDLRTECCAS